MIAALDHMVLTVRDVAATVRFYSALGMEAREFAEGRMALHCGSQKLNLHRAGHEFAPHAQSPLPGSADFCFLVDRPLEEVMEAMRRHGIAIEEGPVPRTGATGPIRSVYCRDPDGNLVELAEPQSA